MKKVAVFAWLFSLASRAVTLCEIPNRCQTDLDCKPGECCRDITFSRSQGSYCIAVPVKNELCDPDAKLSCPCVGNLSCQGRELQTHSQTSQKLKTYLQNVYIHDHSEGNQTCPNKIQPDQSDYVCGKVSESHLQPARAGPQQQCSRNSDCRVDECCIQITCAGNEQTFTTHALSFCTAIPGDGDPCDPRARGTSLTCPCGHNLTCSFSETTLYGYYREEYYQCICKHTPVSMKCNKFKQRLEGLKHTPGSICRATAEPMFEQCGTRSQVCSLQQCCLQITCASIEKKSKVATLSICDSIPDTGDPCDSGSTGTMLTCPCRQGLTCSHSENTRFSYYREKYYRCLCRNPSNSNKCHKYKKHMEMSKSNARSNAGSVCRPSRQQTPSLCQSSQDCGPGHCCIEIACQKNSINELTPESVSFCLPIPAEGEICDPDGSFLCPCERDHDCVRPTDENDSNDLRVQTNYYSHKQEKVYAMCLCTNYSNPSECQYIPKNKPATWNHQHDARCQRTVRRPLTAQPIKFQPSVAPINTPIVAAINTPSVATVPPIIEIPATSTEVRCFGGVGCRTDECCVEVSCSGIKQKSRADTVSVCSTFPQNGEPCHLGSTGTTFSCTCGQNLTCSHSKTTKYGYHRERFFKCLCRYPDDSKKCDRYKKNMVKHLSNPGSVCRHIPQPRLDLCGSKGCSKDQCCIEMACQKNSSTDSRPDSVSFCLSTPGLYEKCDPKDTNLCPCQSSLFCLRSSDDHHRGFSTQHNYDQYKKEKDYANCLCNHFSTPEVCNYSPEASSERRSPWNHQYYYQCRQVTPSVLQSMVPLINTPPSLQ